MKSQIIHQCRLTALSTKTPFLPVSKQPLQCEFNCLPGLSNSYLNLFSLGLESFENPSCVTLYFWWAGCKSPEHDIACEMMQAYYLCSIVLTSMYHINKRLSEFRNEKIKMKEKRIGNHSQQVILLGLQSTWQA